MKDLRPTKTYARRYEKLTALEDNHFYLLYRLYIGELYTWAFVTSLPMLPLLQIFGVLGE
ncbi:unnamed protein product [marine sediment metagenome]|uniref:Uncharacterized protein n=1 Tax=marine sediment metagenome TaxID=412755 RepID=X1NBK0_9ZZZZ